MPFIQVNPVKHAKSVVGAETNFPCGTKYGALERFPVTGFDICVYEHLRFNSLPNQGVILRLDRFQMAFNLRGVNQFKLSCAHMTIIIVTYWRRSIRVLLKFPSDFNDGYYTAHGPLPGHEDRSYYRTKSLGLVPLGKAPAGRQIRPMAMKKPPGKAVSGRLKIGDDWNAITIIALSQENPLKAIAEFVENSIDARARNITITRGRESGEAFLMVADDGAGVPRDAEGAPDFRYVATHVCDSVKRRLKLDGSRGIQGEFGIGLLSFWTVGEELAMRCAGADGSTHEMHMSKGRPEYRVTRRHTLVPEIGTRLKIRPLLPGVRRLSGEKIQWYLASELRERIRQSGVSVKVIDRTARKEYPVEPRQFTGQLLHNLPPINSANGEVYVELYIAGPGADNSVGLYRSGTRILKSISELDAFQRPPWTEGILQGIVDVSFLQLTPATRTGVVQDAALESFVESLQPLESELIRIIEEQKRAEDERTSTETLRSIQRAFREAMLALPSEEYDWFDLNTQRPAARGHIGTGPADENLDETAGAKTETESDSPQKQFFDFAGPLFSVRIAPGACTLAVNTARDFRAVGRDRSRHAVTENLTCTWQILEGGGRIDDGAGEFAHYHAPEDPGLVRIGVCATQGDVVCNAETLITVTDSLLPETGERTAVRQGLPGYTFEHAPGQNWRSRYDADKNLIVVNSGHRDFIFASRNRMLKLRYIARLFAKEMVLRNFPGLPATQILERFIELALHTEEHLR